MFNFGPKKLAQRLALKQAGSNQGAAISSSDASMGNPTSRSAAAAGAEGPPDVPALLDLRSTSSLSANSMDGAQSINTFDVAENDASAVEGPSSALGAEAAAVEGTGARSPLSPSGPNEDAPPQQSSSSESDSEAIVADSSASSSNVDDDDDELSNDAKLAAGTMKPEDAANNPVIPSNGSFDSSSSPPLDATLLPLNESVPIPPGADFARRPLGLFPLVVDAPPAQAGTQAGSSDSLLHPSRSGSSTTPVRSLSLHRPSDVMTTSSNSSTVAAGPSKGQGWVSPLFGNKAHSSRRFSPYRESRASMDLEAAAVNDGAGAGAADSRMISSVISQLYPELSDSLANIVNDRQPSQNVSPGSMKAPQGGTSGSSKRDVTPQGSVSLAAPVLSDNSWQRGIEWSKRNRSEQLQQLQRRRSRDGSPSGSRRDSAPQIESPAANKAQRGGQYRSSSPGRIAPNGPENNIIIEHERLLYSLQQSLNDVHIHTAVGTGGSKDNSLAVPPSRRANIATPSLRATSAPNLGMGSARQRSLQAAPTPTPKTPSYARSRKVDAQNFGVRTAPPVPKRGDFMGGTINRLSQSAGPSSLRRTGRSSSLEAASPRLGSPTRLELKFKALPRSGSPIKRPNAGDVKEDIYGMDLSALQRFLSPQSGRPGVDTPSGKEQAASKAITNISPTTTGASLVRDSRASHGGQQMAQRNVMEDSTLELTTAAEWARLFDWLRRIQMEKYAEQFKRSGITKLSIVELLRGPDLSEIGVDISDQPRILQGIREFSNRTVALVEQAMRSQGASMSSSSRRAFSPALSRSQVLSSLPRSLNSPSNKEDAKNRPVGAGGIGSASKSKQSNGVDSPKIEKLASPSSSGRRFRPTPLKELLGSDGADKIKSAPVENAASSPSVAQSQPGTSPSAAARLLSSISKSPNGRPESLNIVSTLLSINRSFRLGDENAFNSAWARVVSSISRGAAPKASTLGVVSAMQFLEFFSKVYFVIYPQRASLAEDVCREARNRFRDYLERVLADAATRTSALVRSREFATYAGIAVIPDARANAAYVPLFADKWSEGLLLRLNAFINGLLSPSGTHSDQTPPPSKNYSPSIVKNTKSGASPGGDGRAGAAAVPSTPKKTNKTASPSSSSSPSSGTSAGAKKAAASIAEAGEGGEAADGAATFTGRMAVL